ncbi:MAG: FAD:protein FMN transferase, partial [Gemmiger sp.]
MMNLGRRAASLALGVVLAVSLVLPFAGCAAKQEKYTVTWWDVFDTVTVVTGYAASEEEWDRQTNALHEDLLKYHRLYDIYNHYDGITNMADVNERAAEEAVVVGGEIMGLLVFGKQMAETTGGACNMAAGAVLRYWHD